MGSTDGVRDVLEPKSYATMPTTVPTTMPTMPTTMPTTIPTRTVSTVSTVRTRRYGGSTLRYGLYGTKYLLLLYGTVSSVFLSGSLVRSTLSGTLQYGLYGTEYSTVRTLRYEVPFSTLRCGL